MKREEMSIVIPVRNREGLIGRCLDSVKAQAWRPIRIIVVDNGSSDDTREVVKEWFSANEEAELKLTLVEEPAPGAAVARNRGLKEVDTEFMLFFDSDDVMLPGLIEKVMAAFMEDGQPDIVHWRTETILGAGRKKISKFTLTDEWRCHIYHAMLATLCYAVRTDFFKKTGGWNESLTGWDDWELGIRLLLNNPKLKGINEVLARIYPQTESITGSDFNSKVGIWERAIDTAEGDVEQSGRSDSEWLIDMINYRRVILAAHYKREGRGDLAKPLLCKALVLRTVSSHRRWLLRLIYYYTALGGRGAYLLWR